MAGAITHLLVAEEALSGLKADSKELRRILTENLPFLLLGSVAPDLPYLDLVSREQKLYADLMHYEHTNLVPIRMLNDLGKSESAKRAEGWAQFAFILGYIAHCVTDATIHPIVLKAVGAYSLHSQDHRRCEMAQDSLLFKKVKGRDLQEAGYVDVLRQCAPDETLNALFELWASALQATHLGVEPNPTPGSWYQFYKEMLSAATGWTLAARCSKALVGDKGLVYLAAKDILELLPHKQTFWFDNVKLPFPAAEHGPFYEHGFKKAAGNTTVAWKAAYQDYRNAKKIGKEGEGGQLGNYLKNWDLDTGADMDEVDTRVTYWK
jgi:hypothetical protein